jgi:hypothetical protein
MPRIGYRDTPPLGSLRRSLQIDAPRKRRAAEANYQGTTLRMPFFFLLLDSFWLA